MQQIIRNYADDLPLIDALVEQCAQKSQGHEWTMRDLRRAAMDPHGFDRRMPVAPVAKPAAPVGDCRKCGGPYARVDTECTWCGSPL